MQPQAPQRLPPIAPRPNRPSCWRIDPMRSLTGVLSIARGPLPVDARFCAICVHQRSSVANSPSENATANRASFCTSTAPNLRRFAPNAQVFFRISSVAHRHHPLIPGAFRSAHRTNTALKVLATAIFPGKQYKPAPKSSDFPDNSSSIVPWTADWANFHAQSQRRRLEGSPTLPPVVQNVVRPVLFHYFRTNALKSEPR
jgi:hypothetical protein